MSSPGADAPASVETNLGTPLAKSAVSSQGEEIIEGDDEQQFRARGIRGLEAVGFERGVTMLIETSRALLEAIPQTYGRLEMRGLRYEPIVAATARRAESERQRIGHDFRRPATRRAAIIPATVFTGIAYGHAYNDGNKRTGFLAGVAVGRTLGFRWKEPLGEWPEMLEAIRLFVEGNESGDDERVAASGARHVARWMLEKVFSVPRAPEG